MRRQARPPPQGGGAVPPPDQPRPRRDDVADSYDLAVQTYEELWSPVILPPAVALAGQLDLTRAALVAEVGSGTGALPLGSDSADAVILAYVLFHLADPVRALAEAARVLRPGGRAGAITWAWERVPRAGALWDQVLDQAGVPRGPLRTEDAGLNSPQALAATLRSAGLRPLRIWSQPLRRQWDRATYLRLASGLGAGQIRLSLASPAVRAKVLSRFRHDLDRLDPADLLFEGEVCCAVATF